LDFSYSSEINADEGSSRDLTNDLYEDDVLSDSGLATAGQIQDVDDSAGDLNDEDEQMSNFWLEYKPKVYVQQNDPAAIKTTGLLSF